MTDEKSGTRSSVGLLDIATHVPGLLMDAPTILRGVITGFGARPSAKTSIGKVFQERAARYADKVFIKFDDEQITYREANETVNRYAAVLAARGVGHGDVVGIMLRNSPRAGAAHAGRGQVRRDRRECSTTTSAATCSSTASGCWTPRPWSPTPTSSTRSPRAAPTPTA